MKLMCSRGRNSLVLSVNHLPSAPCRIRCAFLLTGSALPQGQVSGGSWARGQRVRGRILFSTTAVVHSLALLRKCLLSAFLFRMLVLVVNRRQRDKE